MITLNLDWREVLWWMQGGMAGSHLRWSVYEDMVNCVWPQASEQERRNMFLIMRRDFGDYWRPKGFNGWDFSMKGEGEWREDILDDTALGYFRRVLACFNPENQYAVTLRISNSNQLDSYLALTAKERVIEQPFLGHFKKLECWESSTATLLLRTYKWQEDMCIDWSRRCAKDAIIKIEKMEIPDNGIM